MPRDFFVPTSNFISFCTTTCSPVSVLEGSGLINDPPPESNLQENTSTAPVISPLPPDRLPTSSSLVPSQDPVAPPGLLSSSVLDITNSSFTQIAKDLEGNTSPDTNGYTNEDTQSEGILVFLSSISFDTLPEFVVSKVLLLFYFPAKSSMLEDGRVGLPRRYDDVFFSTSTPNKEASPLPADTDEESAQDGFVLNTVKNKTLAPRDILARAFTGYFVFVSQYQCPFPLFYKFWF